MASGTPRCGSRRPLARQARNGLSAADYQKTFDDLVKQGYRLTWVSAHEAGGALRYEAIWEKKGGPAWEARNNLTAAEYQQTFDSLTKQGYRPIHVSGAGGGGSARYAAIFDKSSGPAWQARHAMTAAQFQKAFDDFAQQGYRLTDISGYNVGGTDFYAALWEKQAGPWWQARNGIPDAWYQNVFDNYYYQGYTPLLITAFTSGGRGRMNGIWSNTNFKASDLDLINSRMNGYLKASTRRPARRSRSPRTGGWSMPRGSGTPTRRRARRPAPRACSASPASRSRSPRWRS